MLFDLTLPSSGPLYSASMIERRRVEAEKAERRAQELEHEAEQRTAELEEARKRAGEAAEDAHVAERERDQAEAAAFEASRQSPPRA